MLKNLTKQDFILQQPRLENLKKGSVILHEHNGIMQIAKFIMHTSDGMILENVINLNDVEFTANQGLLHPEDDDRFYTFDSEFTNDALSITAINVIRQWTLYSQYPALQMKIINFAMNAFPPAMIHFLQKTDSLKYIFIPVQQKFKIGRFTDRQRWEDFNLTTFSGKLNSLITNENITYMGYLPNSHVERAVFYSLGNETHLETDMKLKKEPIMHNSNCGGNIKLLKDENESKIFLVDAGSSYKGKGVKSTLDDAREIAFHLKKIFPGFKFIPVEGRGAIGSQHSF